MLSAVGEERGANGMSLTSQRRILGLHSVLTLREVEEAAGPNDVDAVMRVLGWLPTNGLDAQRAYTRGFLRGQKRALPVVRRVQGLARALLADDSVAADLADSLRMAEVEHYQVLVVRMTGEPLPEGDARSAGIAEDLLTRHQVPMTWCRTDEFVALLPVPEQGQDAGPQAAERRALDLVRDLVEIVGRPCSVGAAVGRVGSLAGAHALARRISRVVPAEASPHRLHTLRDVFVELGVTELPQIDEWLRDLATRLASGPDLVATLDAFYRHDMNRLHTAGALHIHPRTLDYRLHRVRELAGMDPGSTRGVRTLSTVVARLLAGRWAEAPAS
ncbi:helix-turn-helix domain-containing protein [Streptomyces sp. B6B3]